ncbi:MAG: ABC transporter permease [Armatimonadetes bacterium]|nr:ABC transporter permease [Armatimonadota bacterium]
MNLRNVEYLIQEAFIGIWRNGIMAVASISIVALSMAIFGAFLLLVLGSHNFVERQLARFEIAVYLPVGESRQKAIEVRDQIRALPLARKVTLMSREKEWASFKRRMNTEIDLGGVTGNPLPYALHIESKDSRKTSRLADQIRHINGVAHVTDSRETYGRVKAVADLVKILGFAAALVLCFTTIFIISNAIRLTLFARRHEIQIMQLVGATNWFIRIPLVLEGIILGAMGALIAGGLISLGSGYIVNVVQERFPPLLRDISSGVDSRQFSMSLAMAGAFIGALGSFVSIRRFLRT